MKALILAASAAVALASFSGAATASCVASATNIPVNTVATLNTELGNKTVCVPDAAPANWKWQEFHQGGGPSGALIDWKKGPTDPVDKSEQVGTWTVTGQGDNGVRATVTHNYGDPGGPYTYSVYKNTTNGTFSFCRGGQDIFATILPGQVACH